MDNIHGQDILEVFRSGENVGARVKATGKEVIPAHYKLIAYMGHDLYAATGFDNQGQKNWYILRSNGRTLNSFPASYELRSFINPTTQEQSDFTTVKSNNKEGLLDKEGRFILQPEKYDDIIQFDFIENAEYARVILSDKMGLINRKGEEEIFPVYDKILWMNDYMNFHKGSGYLTVKLNDQWGVLDSTFTVLVPPFYDDIYGFNKSTPIHSTITLDGKKGLIDEKGTILISPKYDEIHVYQLYENGYATVTLEGKTGLINLFGKEIAPPKYDNIYSYRLKEGDHYAESEIASQKGLICIDGREILPPLYDDISYDESRIYVTLNEKIGIFDKNGNPLTPIKYDDKGLLQEGVISVELNGKWGVLDINGKEVIPFQYDYIHIFSEGLAEAKLNDKYGFIDKAGNVVIPFQFDGGILASNFSEGLAAVYMEGKVGYIDKTGNVVIPFQYYMAHGFKNGKAFVFLNSTSGSTCIDKLGNPVVCDQ